MRIAIVSLVCMLAALVAPAVIAQGAMTVTQPLDLQIFNPCNGELIAVTGTIRGVTLNFPATGPTPSVLQIHAHAVGVGSFGNEYIVNGQQTVVITPGSIILIGTELNLVVPFFNIQVIGLGQAPNFLLHANTHTNLNTGVLTSNIFATCHQM